MAKQKRKENAEGLIYLVAIVAWLIPGAGHWLAGQRDRAIYIFLGVGSLFFLGIMLGSIFIIDPGYSKPWFCAQILVGGPALIAALAAGMDSGVADIYGRGVDLGQVYTGVAGLLNLMCILDALVRYHFNEEGKTIQLDKRPGRGGR